MKSCVKKVTVDQKGPIHVLTFSQHNAQYETTSEQNIR